MGTPEIAAGCLSAVVNAGHDVVCVYSQPPRPAGRGQKLRNSPVHALAESMGLPVRTPKTLKPQDEIDAFAALNVDAAVVVAYGQILRQPILDAPRRGCFNLHASLLPRWRGAAPIQRAIMAGDAQTGVQVMRMEAGLDTGPVLMSQTIPIDQADTAGTLHDKLARAGADILPVALDAIGAGTATQTPQAEDGVTYAHKIDKAEARIDWHSPAVEVDRLIRGLSPFPGAWFEWPGEKRPIRVKALMSRVVSAADLAGADRSDDRANPPAGSVIVPGSGLHEHRLVVQCVDGGVELRTVQREGKKPQSGAEFLRGVGRLQTPLV